MQWDKLGRDIFNRRDDFGDTLLEGIIPGLDGGNGGIDGGAGLLEDAGGVAVELADGANDALEVGGEGNGQVFQRFQVLLFDGHLGIDQGLKLRGGAPGAAQVAEIADAGGEEVGGILAEGVEGALQSLGGGHGAGAGGA